MNCGYDIQPDEISADSKYFLKHGIPISQQIVAGPTATPVVGSLTLVSAHVQGGQWLYAHHCSQCRGADQKGNPAWPTELADGSHLPPPLDNTGSAWKYPEGDLSALVKAGCDPDKAIHMPAFKNFSDWEFHFILQYITREWDVNQRNYQAGFYPWTPQPTFGFHSRLPLEYQTYDANAEKLILIS